MDHLGTDRTGVFRNAGVATPDVSSCSRFISLVCEKTTEKIGYKIFDHSILILDVCLNVYLSLQNVKDCIFLHTR